MPDSAELKAGAQVTPSIRLEKLLGRGGMGSVWLAEHLVLRTHVVVKFMTADHADSPEAQQRFRREAELAAQAKSPHVVQIFDHGISQLGIPYIAMELLEGEDLGKRIAKDGAIEPRRFADWLSQACRGLARAHAKGIVHRDIKPENIFLCDNDGEVLVKVLDFGVAKGAFDPAGFLSTRTGAMLGTAYYMSPEQTMGKKDIDHRTDLWALAVVTFYALSGERPFTGDGIGPLVLSITTEPLPLLSEKNPALGGALDAWMRKALSRAREERFQSAKELAESFVEAAGAAERKSVVSGAASWPLGPVPPPQPIASEKSLADSTLSPSVSSGSAPQPAASVPSVAQRRPSWLVPVAAGAVLGLMAVLALLSSRNDRPSSAPTTASSTLGAISTPALPAEVSTPAPPADVSAHVLPAEVAPSSTPEPSAVTPRRPTPSAPSANKNAASAARTRPAAAAVSAKPAASGAAPAAVKSARPAPAVNPLDMKIE